MEVLVLGTGAAGGWPQPFCACPSCTALRVRGEVRAQSSALVDDRLLLDCGPDALRNATRAGRDVRGLRAVLLTHEHPDHVEPSFLLWHAWARTGEPLLVTGPAAALDRCADWVGPDDLVELREVRPGDRFAVDQHEVLVHAADHKPGSVLYDVTGPDGARLLYATDTGPLPAPTVDALRGRRLDLVLVECSWGDPPADLGLDLSGHHTREQLAATVTTLRDAGAVGPSSRVIAVHLGHHNAPDPAELATRLAEAGAETVDDLTVLDVEPGRGARVRPQRPAHRPGARRVLVTGGVRSGKSRAAEALVGDAPRVTYVATGTPPGDDDPEWAARVAEHRRRRPERWRTVETLDVAAVLRAADAGDAVLVDCVSLWLSRTLDAHDAWTDETAGLAAVEADADRLVEAVVACPARVVLVTNEVGGGVVPGTPAGRLYRDLLGALNTRLADAVDEVRLVVAGREVVL